MVFNTLNAFEFTVILFYSSLLIEFYSYSFFVNFFTYFTFNGFIYYNTTKHIFFNPISIDNIFPVIYDLLCIIYYSYILAYVSLKLLYDISNLTYPIVTRNKFLSLFCLRLAREDFNPRSKIVDDISIYTSSRLFYHSIVN